MHGKSCGKRRGFLQAKTINAYLRGVVLVHRLVVTEFSAIKVGFPPSGAVTALLA